MPQNHVLGVSTPDEHEFGIKQMLRRQLEGLRFDFSGILKFDLEIGFNGVLRHGEHEYRNKNSYDVLLRTHTSTFQNNYKFVPNFSSWLF